MRPNRAPFLGVVAAVSACLLLTPVGARANSLAELYRLAAQNDLTLQAASYQRDAAREANPRAWSALLPLLTAQGYARENRRRGVATSTSDSNAATLASLDENYTSSGYSLNLSQTIFDWSAFRAISVADNQVAQAQAAYQSAEQSLLVRVVRAYFAVLSAEEGLRADQSAAAAYKQQLDSLQESFKSGVAPVTDVKNAQAAYDASTATVLVDTTAAGNARRALAVIVGRPIGSLDPLKETIGLLPPNPGNVESWSKAASTDNPDVVAAGHAAEAADRQVSVAFGKHLPTLSAVGTLGHVNSNSRFGNDLVTDYFGVSLSWNIFQGGAVMSSVRQAEALAAQTQTLYQLQMRVTDQNVRNDFDGVVNGIATVNAAASAVASQQASVLATEVGLKVGVRNVIDALTARQALATAQKTFAQSRYDYLISLLSLKGDVGQLSRKDLEDIDRLLAGSTYGGRQADEPRPQQ